MKGRLRLFVGLAVSLVCLYLALRAVDLRLLWETYRGANYLYLVPALVLIVLISWARAYRWRLLMHPDAQQPLARIFSIVNIGYLFNGILPAKAGEAVRGYLAGRILPGGIAQAVSSLLVERFLDVLALVLLLVALLPFVDLPTWAIRAGLLFGAVSVGGALMLVALALFGDRGLDLLWKLLGRLPWVGQPRVRAVLGNLLLGFRVLTVGRLLPAIGFWSLAVWGGYVLFNYTFLSVFRLGHLPLTAAALALCASGFAMVLPSSPGGFGPFQVAIVLALGPYGLGESQAFGYAFGLHAFTNIVLILLGFWGLRSESLSFSTVRRQTLASEATAEPVEEAN